MSRLTPTDIAAIRAREQAATAGPWYAVLYADTWHLQSGPDYTDRGLDGHDDSQEDDADHLLAVYRQIDEWMEKNAVRAAGGGA